VPYAAHGYAQYYCLSILDKHHHPDIDLERGLELMKMCHDEVCPFPSFPFHEDLCFDVFVHGATAGETVTGGLQGPQGQGHHSRWCEGVLPLDTFTRGNDDSEDFSR